MGRASTAFHSSKIYTAFVVIAAFSSFIMCNISYGAQSEELVDKIVAIVESQPILYSEIAEKEKTGPLVLVSDFPADEKSPAFERALNDAINYELILNKISELEIDVSDEQVETQIDQLLKGQNLTRDGLYQFLSEQNKSYEQYKKDFKNQMLLRRFQGRVIAPLIKITDKDIETYFLEKSGNKSNSVQFNLRQILISVDADASENIIAAKKSLAKEVYQKLQGGTKFLEAVKLYSDGPNARTNGGLMAGINLKDLTETLRTEIERLEVGEFTEPIKTEIGFHIFYLEEKKFTENDEYKSKKDQLEYELRNLELNTQTRRWLQQARQKAKIEILEKG
ncbi:MAG: peptidylprolyl isomerase [Bdellovibrionota bacterium]